MRSVTRARRGFTLIELIAATALAGVVVVMIGLVLRQIDVTRDVIRRHADVSDKAGAGALMLRRLFASADATTDSTRQFSGDARYITMPTWCEQPGGWVERCVVHVALDQHADSAAVLVQFENGSEEQLLMLGGRRTFVFLDDANASHWFTNWGRGSIPPFAIGMVDTAGDTVVFTIGTRS